MMLPLSVCPATVPVYPVLPVILTFSNVISCTSAVAPNVSNSPTLLPLVIVKLLIVFLSPYNFPVNPGIGTQFSYSLKSISFFIMKLPLTLFLIASSSSGVLISTKLSGYMLLIVTLTSSDQVPSSYCALAVMVVPAVVTTNCCV